MKAPEPLPRYRQFWVTGLAVTLLMLSVFLIADAQTSQNKIITTGENSEFQQALVQPPQFFETLGIAPEEAQRRLDTRTRILIKGASFALNVDLASFSDTQQMKSGIHVVGAGFARSVGLVALTEIQNLQQSRTGIQITGAGSTRGIYLLSPSLE